MRWDKAACRFCGTGCWCWWASRTAAWCATQGDPDAPVNRGLNCIKGYFLSKIMYGEDRLTQPLLRMKDGKYAKDGEFTADHLEPGLRHHGRASARHALKAKGPAAIGMFGSGQWTIWEGYAASKLMQGRLPLQQPRPRTRATAWPRPWPASCAPSACDEPMGCYDDIEHADAFVLWGSNMAEMHPILWTRVTDRRLSGRTCKVARAVHLRAPQLRARRHSA